MVNQALSNSRRRSILVPLLVSLGFHVLVGALVFWQASQVGGSSELPISLDVIETYAVEEPGSLSLVDSSSPSRYGKFDQKSLSISGTSEESSSPDSFIQEAHVGELPGFQENTEIGPIVHHQNKGSVKSAPGTGTSRPITSEGGGGILPGEKGANQSSFPTIGANQSIVYLIDQSISMGLSGGLDVAKSEVMRCIEGLPDNARFQVVFYTNHRVEAFKPDSQIGLLPASDRIKEQARKWICAQRPKDGTQHLDALLIALQLRPKVIVLITDADDLSFELVKKITTLNEQACIIHTIELSKNRKGDEKNLLALLATRNGGIYQQLK